MKYIRYVDLCDGEIDCPGTEADEIGWEKCKGRFYCDSLDGKVSVPIREKCDGVIHCLDGSDETGEACPDRFWCSSQNGKLVRLFHDICYC